MISLCQKLSRNEKVVQEVVILTIIGIMSKVLIRTAIIMVE